MALAGGAALWPVAEAESVGAADASVAEADGALPAEAEGSVPVGATDADADAEGAEFPALAALDPGGMATRVHTFSSLTSGVPVWSVNGVIVMLHVSCMGPADLVHLSISV